MNFIRLIFYFSFAGNILIHWGLTGSREDTENISFRFALVFLCISSVSAIFFGIFYTFILCPLKLESLSPVVFLIFIYIVFYILNALLKSKNKSLNLNAKGFHIIMVVYAIAVTTGFLPIKPLRIFISAFACAFGALAAAWFLENIMKRLDLEDIPQVFKGSPIRLISVGLMAMAFYGIEISFFSLV